MDAATATTADRRPPGCGCDPTTWPAAKPIPPVCEAYQMPKLGSGRRFCRRCLHSAQCHPEWQGNAR
jgi:hypothetical protein